MKRRATRHNTNRRPAATVVLVGVSMVTLLLFASLAVDVGYICALTAEAQNNADAGALAGANLLQEEEYDNLRERVLHIIGLNQRPQGFLSLDDQLVEFGKWDSATQTFYRLPPEDWEAGAFAVRVRAERNNVALFFATVMGHNFTHINREAVAIGTRPCEGIWGLNGVRVVGNVTTDSYESDDGPYDPDSAGDNGDLCSGAGITVNGSVEVNGDVMTGFGYPITVNGAPIITGVTSDLINGVISFDVDTSAFQFANDNNRIPLTDNGSDPWDGGWNLRVPGDDRLQIPPGTYYLESLVIHSTSTLAFAGPTTFYVAGDIDATGGAIINSSGDPSYLTIVSSGDSVKIGGSEALYATIIAPYADVELAGNGDVYGALIGGTVTMKGNFEFHVDDSLPVYEFFSPPPPFLVK